MSVPGHDQDQFSVAIHELRAQALQTRQRRALLLSGAADWCRQAAQIALIAAQLEEGSIWMGHDASPGKLVVAPGKARKLLGHEYSAVVYDCHCGLDPDAVGIAAGVIAAGGLLILLTPLFDEWPAFNDPEYMRILPAGYGPDAIRGRFLRRVVRILRENASLYHLIVQGRPLFKPVDDIPQSVAHYDSRDLGADQALAVEAICRMVSATQPYPLVIIADRGRGKSAALGIAAAKLSQEQGVQIIVTALRRDAVNTVYKHAGIARNEIRFVAPDELIASDFKPDLLLVDEAAAIPAQMLEKLLERYPQIVFTSTTHGYEGTGRGFATRFISMLDKRYPAWKLQRLEVPIRWAKGDPVERLVFKMLLMDAEPAADAGIIDTTPEKCTISPLDRDRLVIDEEQLSEQFGLLIAAHYRTRPYDLLNLLDGPNVSGLQMMHEGHVVATALFTAEGAISPSVAEQIYQGIRRPRGHLLPQSLAAHAGCPAAAEMKYRRIMRIAVHPALHRRGMGKVLLHAAEIDASESGIDIIGASFSATPELLRFWLSHEYRVVRIGLSREHSSGMHSLMLLKGISDRGVALVERLEKHLETQIAWLLRGPLQDLEPAILEQLGSLQLMTADNIIDTDDKRDLLAFAEGTRGFEVSFVALAKLESNLRGNVMEGMLKNELVLLGDAIHEYGKWGLLASKYGKNGKAEIISALRRVTQTLLSAKTHFERQE